MIAKHREVVVVELRQLLHIRGHIVHVSKEVAGLPEEDLDFLLAERCFDSVAGGLLGLQIAAHVVYSP